VLRGRPVYVLVIDQPPDRDGAGSGSGRDRQTFVLDRRSNLPIELRYSNEGFQEGKSIRSSGVQRFQVYEKLPRTPVNLAALRPSKER